MKMIAAAVAIALYGVHLASGANVQTTSKTQAIKSVEPQPELVKFSHNPDKKKNSHIRKFIYEPQLVGEHTYIVELLEQSVSENSLSAKTLKNNRLNRQQNSHLNKTSIADDPIKQQLRLISAQQNSFLTKAQIKVPKLNVQRRYEYALNGLAILLTQDQAQALSELPEVLTVSRQKIFKTDTDRGPNLVGAPMVWSGTASPTVAQTQGEGIIVGIIDSGINTDHPSFAEVSGDGYVHANPLGDGNYLGDCAINFAELCNNKLIGVYSYTDITDDYADTEVFPPNLPRNGEDYGGHGSHVAATAAGNVLLNVAETLPEIGQESSSGVSTGFSFAQISGVAPRANIISYQACYGGRSDADDTYGDCPGSAILKAIDDAVGDQVDVINFSISGGGNPWNDQTERAFLNARNAGIFVATSAGNSGPDPESSEKNAPWYTSVAASEHGRQNAYNKQIRDFTGGLTSLGAISGQSNSGSITASIVYAGDFANSNDTSGDTGQCLVPFPSGTFSGQIVVCDRGDIARIEKAENVRDGGAGGYVLANVPGGDTFLANDQYVVPGIHINAEDGANLKAWLASGANHSATITAGVSGQSVDESRVDVLASFSSRGPNATNSTLTPSMTAPGVDIYAAYADEQFGHDGHTPAAGDFEYLSGTSMASPHVAGAAALIKAARPDWDPDHIRSALSLTANTNVKREDASSDADFFDMGAGRIQVNKAIASGLIMSETGSNYTNANPTFGGEPRSLNLPSITDDSCAGTCTWVRTFTATTDATWSVNIDSITDGLNVIATPSSFTLSEGQSQSLSFVIESAQAPKTEYSFASVRLSSPGLPDARIPISVFGSIGNIPLDIEIDSRRQIDSALITDIEAIDIPDFNLIPYKPVKATVVNEAVTEDSENTDIFDDLTDGVHLTTIDVPENAVRLITQIKTSTAPDLDLYVIFDSNNDGIPSSNEILGESLSSNSAEEVAINFPNAGRYFIVVQSFTGSVNQPDTFDMRYAVVTKELATSELTAVAPNSIFADTPFDLRVIHNLPEAQAGDDYYAAIGMGTDQGLDNLGMINVDINRIDDDVIVDGTPTRVEPNQVVPLKVLVEPNFSTEARNYEVIVPLPVGTAFGNFSTSNQGQEINNQLIWLVEKPAGNATTTELDFDLRVLNGVAPGPILVIAQSQLINQSFSELEDSQAYEEIQIEGPPVLTFNGNDTIELTVTETENLIIPLNITEPNGDSVTVVWQQTSGPTAAITQNNGASTLVAPSVTEDTQLAYTVTVTDINSQEANAQITVNVLDNSAPVITSIDAPTSANGGQQITLTVNASDPENQTLQITVNGNLIAGTTTTLRTPTSGSSVSYTINVSDGITTVSQTVTVTLTQSSTTPTNNTGGGGGSLSFWIICLLPVIIFRRKLINLQT